jgi:hypothetical protein
MRCGSVHCCESSASVSRRSRTIATNLGLSKAPKTASCTPEIGAADHVAKAFDAALWPVDLLVFALLELRNGFDVLHDLVGPGTARDRITHWSGHAVRRALRPVALAVVGIVQTLFVFARYWEGFVVFKAVFDLGPAQAQAQARRGGALALVGPCQATKLCRFGQAGSMPKCNTYTPGLQPLCPMREPSSCSNWSCPSEQRRSVRSVRMHCQPGHGSPSKVCRPPVM